MILKDSEIGVETVYFPDGTHQETPFYTCGHCNVVIHLRAERTRPRVRCGQCGRLICEKTDLCATACTPVPDLAKDHLEGRVAQKFGKRLEAIFSGASSVNEAVESGLLLEE